jgi:nucleoside 2-deoxyribosyltransferase
MERGKIYISGKITGLTIEEATEKFEDAEIMLKEKGYEVVNPMKLEHNHDKTWESYMREDLKAMLDCDGIYILDNWKSSEGAKLEIAIALRLGFKTISE